MAGTMGTSSSRVFICTPVIALKRFMAGDGRCMHPVTSTGFSLPAPQTRMYCAIATAVTRSNQFIFVSLMKER